MIIGDIYLSRNAVNSGDILKKFPRVKTICRISGISGEFRTPKVKIIYGKSAKTLHKELGISYSLDVSRVMFSQGNQYEKKRLLSLVKPREVVVDMFAGIGYFSLPIATRVKLIYAIEKNPDAFEFLEQNIRQNYISNIIPIKGDCRAVKLGKIADRIIMGYFPGTKKFLPAAFALAKKNCVIHYHDIASSSGKLTREISQAAARQKVNIKFLASRKVKDYSPTKNHFVVDFRII